MEWNGTERNGKILTAGTGVNRVKARGGSRGQKCPILIFQYVIELDKMNQMQKTGD